MSKKIENGWAEQQKEIDRLSAREAETEVLQLRRENAKLRSAMNLVGNDPSWCEILVDKCAEINTLEVEIDNLKKEAQELHDKYGRLWTDNASLLSKMQPIRGVWERFKHLDILLSDEAWMIESGHPMAPQRKALFDCWLAIKEATK